MFQNKRILARCVLFAAAFFWGSSFFIMKNTVDVFPPNYLLAIRFTVASALLAVVFHKRLKKIDKTYIRSGFIIGLSLFLGYFFQTYGLEGTTPGKNAFLTATYCVIVPFMYWAVDKTKPDAYNLTAAFICLIGIGFVSITSSFSMGWGDGLTILSGVFYALNMISVSRHSRDLDVIVLTVIQFAFVALFCWIGALLFETWPAAVSAGSIVSLLYLAVVVTGVAFLFQNLGLKWENPTTASIILSLESVFGVLFSILFYGESVTPRLLLGFVLIFFAVILSETKLFFLKNRTDEKNLS